ncbi:hypothetical protein [Caulobacter henricii]|uniref:hypothetical protein n=1 Tax=Caulobacter henricii TaxID=69395 RepID=UPI0014129F76|nr:hypothetical protein [Caulobacter henricii]
MKLAKKAHFAASSTASEAVETAHEIDQSGHPANLASSIYKSCSPCRDFVPFPGRGGARNTASRRTIALSESDARKVLEASNHAELTGLPFNAFKTIHWERAGVTDDLAATGRFLKLAGDWIRSRGGQFGWAWTREGGPAKGNHVHIVFHLPPELARDFHRRQRGWLKACGARWRSKVVLTRRIGRNLRQALAGGEDYRVNLGEVLDYILKGADRSARERLGIERDEPGGVVIGKRCGISQNLGPAARAQACPI